MSGHKTGEGCPECELDNDDECKVCGGPESSIFHDVEMFGSLDYHEFADYSA